MSCKQWFLVPNTFPSWCGEALDHLLEGRKLTVVVQSQVLHSDLLPACGMLSREVTENQILSLLLHHSVWSDCWTTTIPNPGENTKNHNFPKFFCPPKWNTWWLGWFFSSPSPPEKRTKDYFNRLKRIYFPHEHREKNMTKCLGGEICKYPWCVQIKCYSFCTEKRNMLPG